MARTKYTGHLREGIVAQTRVGALSALKVLREVGRDRVLVAMIVLAGLGSFLALHSGSRHQPQSSSV
jgi:hypothetical protein